MMANDDNGVGRGGEMSEGGGEGKDGREGE